MSVLRRPLVWLLAALLSVLLTLLAFCPASWMGVLLDSRSGGRFALGDAQGTLWNGSAFIGAAPGAGEPVAPLLPGRFHWTLSPLVLLGQVDLTLENRAALSQRVSITGSWNRWQVSPAAVSLPAERLAALGAPLNTIQPAGTMQLSWTPLELVRHGNAIDLSGTMTLRMNNIASRLSPIKPLGDYQLIMVWRGRRAQLELTTIKGPMLLAGSGTLDNGRLRFSGTADAAAGQEEKLANLLNLLGQRRVVNGKNVIALEFK